ncbi:MAG: hypothetical protein N2C12_09825, partial [Planctomycetales bacterium]
MKRSDRCTWLSAIFNQIWIWTLVALISVPAALSTPGCTCQPDPKAKSKKEKEEEARKKKEEEKKKKEKPKTDNESKSTMKVLPNDGNLIQRLKPNHWVSVSQSMRANNRDFAGEVTWKPVKVDGRQPPLDRTGYRITMSRPLNLSKEARKPKDVEMTLFAPDSVTEKNYSKTNYTAEFTQGGSRRRTGTELFSRLEGHEYFLLVLANDPDRYRYLMHMDSVKPPVGDDFKQEAKYYEILLPKITKRVPVSSTVLTWTNTAYILWDDLNPDLLSSEQRQAMLDWLHWGGQLLVSGPESLDSLQGSFLEPYLPVAAGTTIQLAEGDLAKIDRIWTKPYTKMDSHWLSKKKRQWSGVALERTGNPMVPLVTTPDGEPLVVEGQVGRGRIVVTAFRLRERELINWPGYDGFFNNCLLRRPSRVYSKSGEFDELQLDWRKPQRGETVTPARLDPRVSTRMRIFSRDAGYT